MASKLVQVSATGNVNASSGYLKSVVLEAGTAAADLDVRLDGSGGTIVLSLAALAEDSRAWQSGDPDGVYFPGALHATLAGAGATASFEVEQ